MWKVIPATNVTPQKIEKNFERVSWRQPFWHTRTLRVLVKDLETDEQVTDFR